MQRRSATGTPGRPGPGSEWPCASPGRITPVSSTRVLRLPRSGLSGSRRTPCALRFRRPARGSPGGARVGQGQRLDVVGDHIVAPLQRRPGSSWRSASMAAARGLTPRSADRPASRGWPRISLPRCRPPVRGSAGWWTPPPDGLHRFSDDVGVGDPVLRPTIDRVCDCRCAGAVRRRRSRVSSASRLGYLRTLLEQKAVELGLGQGVGALLFDRVLGGDAP